MSVDRELAQPPEMRARRIGLRTMRADDRNARVQQLRGEQCAILAADAGDQRAPIRQRHRAKLNDDASAARTAVSTSAPGSSLRYGTPRDATRRCVEDGTAS